LDRSRHEAFSSFAAYPVYPARVGDTTERSIQFQQAVRTAQLLGNRGGRMQTMIFDSASEIDTSDALSGSTAPGSDPRSQQTITLARDQVTGAENSNWQEPFRLINLQPTGRSDS
jgi:hypothetical protein